MSIEKTPAIILSVLPYRESSCILYLFTHAHGMVHGIAKGVLKQGKQSVRPERGYIIDVVLYIKHDRELHTLSDIQIITHFPSTRSDLVRTSFRDAGFEMVLKCVKVTDPHPELFDLINTFLYNVETTRQPRLLFALLWQFYLHFCQLLGFGLHTEGCTQCGTAFSEQCHGYLVSEEGGLLCSSCSKTHRPQNLITGHVLLLLNDISASTSIPPSEFMRITRLLASYCRYHFEIQSELTTLEFLDTLGWTR